MSVNNVNASERTINTLSLKAFAEDCMRQQICPHTADDPVETCPTLSKRTPFFRINSFDHDNTRKIFSRSNQIKKSKKYCVESASI